MHYGEFHKENVKMNAKEIFSSSHSQNITFAIAHLCGYFALDDQAT